MVIYLGLFLFEDLPGTMVLCGAAAQAAHYVLLASFPFFQLSSPTFIVSVGETTRRDLDGLKVDCVGEATSAFGTQAKKIICAGPPSFLPRGPDGGAFFAHLRSGAVVLP